MKRALYELTETSRRLNYLANYATENSRVHGDDWDIICDAVVDARKSIIDAVRRITGKK